MTWSVLGLLVLGMQEQPAKETSAAQPQFEIVDNQANTANSSKRHSSQIHKNPKPTGKPIKIKSDKPKGVPTFKKPKAPRTKKK